MLANAPPLPGLRSGCEVFGRRVELAPDVGVGSVEGPESVDLHEVQELWDIDGGSAALDKADKEVPMTTFLDFRSSIRKRSLK